jgi:RNA polymerase sigma factor (sigma-70 family)
MPQTSEEILESLRGSRGADGDLARLVPLYWKPVYCLIRKARAATNEDAKDLTQDFFADVVLGNGFAERYDPKKGGFRAYLKGAIRNFLAKRTRDEGREKRGGGARPLSLNIPDADLEEVLADADALSPEEAFDRGWRDVVLARATALLQERLNAAGKRLYFEVFKRYDLQQDGASYETLSQELGITTDDVKNYLTRSREEFRNAVRAVLCESAGSAEGLADEWNALFGS